ncbi:MAG: peptidase M4, partial [Planctomycetota bacterium]
MTKPFKIGANVKRAGLIAPYEREPFDPVVRPLKIYSTDPADSKLDGSLATVHVPYEPLQPGPVGNLFEVIGVHGSERLPYLPLNLEDPVVLIQGGIAPSPTNYHFIMQMTYAVAMSTYEAFRTALGRNLHWGFDTPVGE